MFLYEFDNSLKEVHMGICNPCVLGEHAQVILAYRVVL